MAELINKKYKTSIKYGKDMEKLNCTIQNFRKMRKIPQKVENGNFRKTWKIP